MKVDLEMLRGLERRYDGLGDSLVELDATSASSEVSGALPNSRTEDVASKAGHVVDTALADFGKRMHSLSEIARSAAESYDSTDEANAARLERAGLLEK